MKKRNWMYLSLGCLAASVISLFVGVISYRNQIGIRRSYNFLDLILNPTDFGTFVSSEYTGSMFRSIYLNTENMIIISLAMVGIGALVCAIIGVMRMSRQRATEGSFILSVVGLAGTALPAISIIMLLLLSADYFPGTISAGPYVVITPIAMVCSIITVTLKHNRNKQQLEARKRVEKYLRIPNDF